MAQEHSNYQKNKKRWPMHLTLAAIRSRECKIYAALARMPKECFHVLNLSNLTVAQKLTLNHQKNGEPKFLCDML